MKINEIIPFWVLMVFIILGTMLIYNVQGEVTNISDVEELVDFLEKDKTDKHKHVEWYSCGHFARDLSKNATKYNLSIGSAKLSNHPVFRGKYNSHDINYVYIKEKIIFIDPQTERLYQIHEIFSEWKYIRLYPDGTQIPSNWIYNLAPTISYNKDTKIGD